MRLYSAVASEKSSSSILGEICLSSCWAYMEYFAKMKSHILYTDKFIPYLKLVLEPGHLLVIGSLMQLAGGDP